jgi:hypothetical protein
VQTPVHAVTIFGAEIVTVFGAFVAVVISCPLIGSFMPFGMAQGYHENGFCKG